MASLNEARTPIEIGECPACHATLEMVLAVELGASKLAPAPGGSVVTFEFSQPKITGAVLKPHDCISKGPVTR